MLKIFTDGGARGNPGPAACAFVAFEDSKEIFKSSRFIGKATNNYAEYQGVILALNWLEKDSHTEFYLDSELAVKQINGLYKIKNNAIRKLVVEIKRILSEKNISASFTNIPRIKNKIADALVNKELDRVS